MSTTSVLLVGEPASLPGLEASLVAAGIALAWSTPAEAPAKVKAGGIGVVCVAPFADGSSARYPAWLVSQVGPGCPPVVLVLASTDAAARDQGLVGGAFDVLFSVEQDALGDRLGVFLDGWERGARRLPFALKLKAQRGRATVELLATDIDGTGLGLGGEITLPANDLVRFGLALSPNDTFTLWGRVVAVEGGRAIRFVGQLPDERSRLTHALAARAKSGAAAPSASSATLPPGAYTAPPAEKPLPPVGSAPTPSSSPAVPPPPAPSAMPRAPMAGAPPGATTKNATLPPAPRGAVRSPAENTQPPAPRPPVAVEAPPAAPVSPAPPPPPAPVVPPVAGETPPPAILSGIGDAIGEMLGDPPAAAPVPASEADVLNAVLEAHRPAWPTSVPEFDPTHEALVSGATMGLAGEETGAPAGGVVLEFAKRMSPIERRYFDEVPPADGIDPELVRRSLVARLMAFAVQKDAEVVLALAQPVSVDDALVGQVTAAVDQVNASLQKLVDGYVLQAATDKIKEVNQFKVALTRSLSDMRGAVGRLKGEEGHAGGNAALLDVAERVPGQEQGVTRRAPPKDEKQEKAPQPTQQYVGEDKLTAEQRSRRRAGRLAVLPAVLLVVAILTWPTPPRPLDLAAIGAPAGVTKAMVTDEGTKLRFTVAPGWSPDPKVAARLAAKIDELGIKQAIFVDDKGKLVAFRQGKEQPIRFFGAGKK